MTHVHNTRVNLLRPPLHKPKRYNVYTGYWNCTCVGRVGIWKVEVQLHIFLISTMHGSAFLDSRPNCSTSSKGAAGAHWIGESVGPKASMGDTQKWKARFLSSLAHSLLVNRTEVTLENNKSSYWLQGRRSVAATQIQMFERIINGQSDNQY